MSDTDLKRAILERAGDELHENADGVIAAAESVDVWSAMLIVSCAVLGIRVVNRGAGEGL